MKPLSGPSKYCGPLREASPNGDFGWWPRFASVLWTLTWVQKYSRRAAVGLPFALVCRPFRLDFHYSRFSPRIVARTAPLPFSRFLDQSALHGVMVNVS